MNPFEQDSAKVRTNKNMRHVRTICEAVKAAGAELPGEVDSAIKTLDFLEHDVTLAVDPLPAATQDYAAALLASASDAKVATPAKLIKAVQESAALDAQRSALGKAQDQAISALIGAVRSNEVALLAAVRPAFESAVADIKAVAAALPLDVDSAGAALLAGHGEPWIKAVKATGQMQHAENVKDELVTMGAQASNDPGNERVWAKRGDVDKYRALRDDQTAMRIAMARGGVEWWLPTVDDHEAFVRSLARAKAPTNEPDPKVVRDAVQQWADRRGDVAAAAGGGA